MTISQDFELHKILTLNSPVTLDKISTAMWTVNNLLHVQRRNTPDVQLTLHGLHSKCLQAFIPVFIVTRHSLDNYLSADL